MSVQRLSWRKGIAIVEISLQIRKIAYLCALEPELMGAVGFNPSDHSTVSACTRIFASLKVPQIAIEQVFRLCEHSKEMKVHMFCQCSLLH